MSLIQFVDGGGARRSMRFGRLNKKEFAQVEFRTKRLIAFRIAGEPPDRETAAWLESVTPYVRKKLEGAELIAPQVASTLQAWIDLHISKKTTAKKSTRETWKRCRRRLIDKLGARTPLSKITAGDARDWRDALFETLSENTVRRQTGIAKQFFADAVRHKIIDSNPFAGLATSMVEVSERVHFITEKDSLAVLDACPDQQWRMIFALARWGGLRCPSEILSLQWSHVDWAGNRMTVLSPKTAHHRGKESRVIPLFPEIRQELDKGFHGAEDGAKWVVTRYRDATQNLRTTFEKIVDRAGVERWPKLFQNLRSTRETELASLFPLHVVIRWMGNSKPIALKNYLQVTDDHFEAAANGALQKRCVSPPQPASSGLYSANEKAR